MSAVNQADNVDMNAFETGVSDEEILCGDYDEIMDERLLQLYANMGVAAIVKGINELHKGDKITAKGMGTRFQKSLQRVAAARGVEVEELRAQLVAVQQKNGFRPSIDWKAVRVREEEAAAAERLLSHFE
ncbi:hypothetical protein Slin15195_G069860 [Septoria linicola]|uniref:Uncharacterized protein n=1 Tax=Septoria linicola TaxID=215465 RepID=A0A9Q9AXC3_9PEZI|nr:hypothetical protein Slin15195_G069860 [Septoria linicola]